MSDGPFRQKQQHPLPTTPAPTTPDESTAPIGASLSATPGESSGLTQTQPNPFLEAARSVRMRPAAELTNAEHTGSFKAPAAPSVDEAAASWEQEKPQPQARTHEVLQFPSAAPRSTPAPTPRGAAAPQELPLLRPRRLQPQSGPRKWVHAATAGLINMGPSAAQQREAERMRRIQRPLHGAHVTTYICLKGGITKTTTCIGTALTAAQYRPEAVVAGDFNPDAGDLAERVTGLEGLSGVNRLAEQVDNIHTIADLNAFLHSEGRLTVLPGEPDPKLGESLTSAQFNAVIETLSSYFGSIHVDAGTGITHPIMPGILARTDTLVIPAAWSVTGAKRADDTLEWLDANGFSRLADSAIIALTERDRVSKDVDKAAIIAMFERRGVPIVRIPADPHLADGAQIRLESMLPKTREAFAEIAALIADRYPA